jgi:hypothetical protein
MVTSSSVLKMRQTAVVEKIKTHSYILYSITISESRAVYEIMWSTKIWYRQAGRQAGRETGHRWQYNRAHALCALDN